MNPAAAPATPSLSPRAHADADAGGPAGAQSEKHASPTYGAYVSEVRFGVVMYGGVSLAIYINGVANELYEMAQATPRDRTSLKPPTPGSTREVYDWLAQLLGDSTLMEQCNEHLSRGQPLNAFFEQRAAVHAQAPRVRLLVDVVSGTSAGGINGVFLAKALANNESFSLLRDLWINEGDIGKLLNDEGSREGDTSLPPIAKYPASLLNSDRMYAKLLKALQDMSATRTDGMKPSVCADELDLFVTTTDIRGATIGLRLFDKLVPERRHRQVFRLRYRKNEAVNDFVDSNQTFLAYAARCTSSFPFAFEPMTLQAAERRVGKVADAARDAWRKLFVSSRGAESDSDPLERAYGDGGYLDNKPFSYAIEALTQREAEVPADRKLIYIEPSPDHPELADRAERAAGRDKQTPNAVSNALAALTSIPRHESIREDLEAVLQRNRLIERVDRIVSQGEIDLELGGDYADPYLQAIERHGDQREPWSQMEIPKLREFYGDAFLPYRRLRVYMVTDKLADRLAQMWGVDPESDRLYALRALVRVWRDRHFSDELPRPAGIQTLNAFLDRFDLRFRTRRLRFLVRRIDAFYRLLQKRTATGLTETVQELSLLHQALLKRLSSVGVDLAAPRLTNFDVTQGLAALSVLRRDFLNARDAVRGAEAELMLLGGADAPAQRVRLRGLLLQTLDLLLDTGVSTLTAEARSRNELQLVDYLPAAARKALEAMSKLPSSTRTLQERVFERAKLLFDEMQKQDRGTALQHRLEADLRAMGDLVHDLVNGTPQRAGLSTVGRRLGKPDWLSVPAPDGQSQAKRIVMPKVGDTGDTELDSVEGRLLRRLLATYYLRYDSYDQMSLPLYYGSNVGEPATVEVIRISPEDATALIDERHDKARRKKLAGTTLANFGGFLDAQWRRNDIMWGRFDGAERLVHALLSSPKDPGNLVCHALTRAAHLAIVNDELAPGARTEVTGLMMQALTQLSAPKAPQGDARIQAVLEQLDTSNPTRRKQVEQVLTMLFENEGLLKFVSDTRDVDRHLDPKLSLQNAARAATVAGRVLEGVSQERDLKAAPRWLARGGMAAQALVAISMPGSLLTLLWRHWLTLLYVFEVLMFGLGLLFSSPGMRSAGLTAFALTAVTHVVTVALRDVMRSRAPWKSRALWVVLAAALLLVALGAWSAFHVPWQCLLPWGSCRSAG